MMTRPPPIRGGFFLGTDMSEERDPSNELADDVAQAEDNQPQGKDKAEAPETQDGVEEDGEEGREADGADDDQEGDGERPKRSRSGTARLKRERDALRQENEMLRSRVPAADDSAALDAAVRKRIGDPPKEGDYGDWFDYRDAKAAYEAEKRVVAREITEASGRQQRAHVEHVRSLAEDYQDNLKEAAAQIPDLVETLQKTKFVPTKTVELLILETGENAPLVSYYLAQNERVADRLNAMPERQALREMGRIEALVSRPKSTATRAPAPLSRPKGGASQTRSVGKSMSDYERWRNQE